MLVPQLSVSCYPNSLLLTVPNIVHLDTDISRFLSKSIPNISLFAHTMFHKSLLPFSLLIVWGGHYAAEAIIPIQILWTMEPVWN